jgi:hypothetical protein
MDYKVLVGVGLIAAGGYLLWKEQQKSKVVTPAEPSESGTKSMLGFDAFTTKVVGERSKRGFVSSLPAEPTPFKYFTEGNLPPKESPFKNFVADNINVQSSNWM